MARKSLSRDEQASEILMDTGVVSGDLIEDSEEAPAPFILVGSASIPVSRKAGKRWKDKIDNALNGYDATRQMWELANKEYQRTANYGIKIEGDVGETPLYFFQNNTDENLTRENVKTLLRNTYTRNPTIELTSIDPDDEDQTTALKEVINQLMGRIQAPGLNAKARVRRWIMHAHLTNAGIIKLDFQGKEGSRAQAQEKLLEVQEKLSKSKDMNQIEDLYAQLEQIDEELPSTREPGLILSNVPAGLVIIDPDCTTLDLRSAKWVDEVVMLSDAYIKNRFLEKNADGVYVRKVDGKQPGGGFGGDTGDDGGRNDLRDKIVNEVLGTMPDSIMQARSKDKSKCHLIWDRLTKQISLWLDGSWDYPLWVYADDLKLSRFYPYHLLAFTEPLDSIVQEGESAQYYGQVQEINKINARVAFVRMLAYGTLIYNTRKIKETEVRKVIDHMKNPNAFDAFGIDWDPQLKLREMFDVFVPPEGDIPAIYDKSDLMKTIDRVNAQSEVSRGGQFKTNTTNKAVEAYGAQQASVQNELTDAVEDALQDLVWSMCEVVVSKYSKEQVIALIGQKLGDKFQSMTIEEFNQRFSLMIASGSTEKPSSANKKREAMEIAQAVGQVGQATPMTSLRIMFRMFKDSFSSFMFTKDDEEMLTKEAEASMSKGVSTPQQPGNAPPPNQPPTP